MKKKGVAQRTLKPVSPLSIQLNITQHMCVSKLPEAGERTTQKGQREQCPEHTHRAKCAPQIARVKNLIVCEASEC